MSLFEWIGEGFDPGPSGSLGVGGKQDRPPRSNGAVLLRFIITVIIIGGIYLLVFAKLCKFNLENAAITTGIIFLYCLLGYLIRPEPDTSNIGWFGGLMDHPFRYSDDINRFLLFLKIFLMPGYFFADSTIDMFLLLRKKKHS